MVNKLKVFGWANYTNEQVVRKVEKCCHTLSEKLGRNQYFYGDRYDDRIEEVPFVLQNFAFLFSPTELDALVFGHIYTILTTSLPNADLQNLINDKFPSLVQFCLRVERQFFSQKK